MKKIQIIASAIITLLLRSPVKAYAAAHHTQFNLGVLILLFAVVLLVFEFASEAREFWSVCDTLADVVEEDDE